MIARFLTCSIFKPGKSPHETYANIKIIREFHHIGRESKTGNIVLFHFI